MRNAIEAIEALVGSAIERAIDKGLLDPQSASVPIVVEHPRDKTHGELATNAALALASVNKTAPRAIAQCIGTELADEEAITHIDIAGPGFINLVLNRAFWQRALCPVLEPNESFGRGAPKEQRVLVEFVSANPTGPLHAGGVRGAVFGDALANLLSFAGYDVTRENYINDQGGQFDALARSVEWRYEEVCAGKPLEPKDDDLYRGTYLLDIARKIVADRGDDLLALSASERRELLARLAIETIVGGVRADLSDLGIVHDTYFFESRLHRPEDKIGLSLRRLNEKGLIERGLLARPRGGKALDEGPANEEAEGEGSREVWLFRTRKFGDDRDRPIYKSDGSYTYFAADIAYHQDKIDRGFDQLINVWGADHGGYVRRMKAAVQALAPKIDFDIKICQIVHLKRGGKALKLSKRGGVLLSLRDMLEELGRDVIRFMMLTRSNDAGLDLDFAEAKAQNRENPVFYVQYAHARACSVLRNAKAAGFDVETHCGLQEALFSLEAPEEMALVRRMCFFPRLIERAAASHEPHRIAFFVLDLAAQFHELWHVGKKNADLRFLNPDDVPLTWARLALTVAVKRVLARSLALLGVRPVEEMR